MRLNLKNIKNLMEEKKAQFNIASKQLPQTDEVPTLLKNISQAGKEAGLAFLLFKPVAESPKEFLCGNSCANGSLWFLS